MSIELKLEALTKAIEENTAALLAAAGGEAAPSKTAAKTTPAKTTPAQTTAAKTTAAKKGEGVTLEQVQEVFGGFLKIDDEKKRATRKKFAATLLEQYGVKKASDVDPQDYAELVSFIERVLAGEKVDPSTAGARIKALDSGEEEEQEEEEEDSMV
jgi:hypothetical protein